MACRALALALTSPPVCLSSSRAVFSLTFMATNLLFQSLLVRYAKTADKCSITFRIVLPLALLLSIFAATAVLVLVKDASRDGMFSFTALSVALCGFCTSVLQAAIFGYAAAFPPRYTQAMMAGQGLAGLIVAAAGLATAASSRANGACAGVHLTEEGPGQGEQMAACSAYQEIDYHALAYFGTAVVILGVCIVSFLYLERLPLAQFFVGYNKRHVHSPRGAAGGGSKATLGLGGNRSGSGKGDDASVVESGLRALPMAVRSGAGGEGAADKEAIGVDGEQGEEASDEESSVGLVGVLPNTDPCALLSRVDSSLSLLSAHGEDERGDGNEESESWGNTTLHDIKSSVRTHQHVSFLVLLRRLGSPGLAVFLVFFITLALFPSTTVHIVSVRRCQGRGVFYDQAFVPFQFLLFNLGDWGGRTLAGHLPSPFLVPAHRLSFYAAARVVFLPLFLLCNVDDSAFPIVFAADWWPMLFMLFFSLSNGYLSSLAMMRGPAQLTVDQAERGGNVMVLLMTAGLSAGSVLSFLVSAVSLNKF